METVEDYILRRLEESRLNWESSQLLNSPLIERKHYGVYITYKNLADGIKNKTFKKWKDKN